jgi:hypothetical protein
MYLTWSNLVNRADNIFGMMRWIGMTLGLNFLNFGGLEY